MKDVFSFFIEIIRADLVELKRLVADVFRSREDALSAAKRTTTLAVIAERRLVLTLERMRTEAGRGLLDERTCQLWLADLKANLIVARRNKDQAYAALRILEAIHFEEQCLREFEFLENEIAQYTLDLQKQVDEEGCR